MTRGSNVHQPSDQFLSWKVDPFAVKDAPRGTVVRHPLLADCFWVRGSGDIYLIQAWRYEAEVWARCPCLGFAFRRTCAHVKAVAKALLTPAVCPLCCGTGRLEERERGPSVSWMDDDDLLDVFR